MTSKPNPCNEEDKILLELAFDVPKDTYPELNRKAVLWQDWFWERGIAFELSDDKTQIIKKNLKLHQNPYAKQEVKDGK